MEHKNKIASIDSFARPVFNLFLSLIVFYSVLIIINSLLLILGQRIYGITVPFTFLVSITLLAFLFYKNGYKTKSICGFEVIYILIIAVIFAISSYSFDRSWDGRDYHQGAVIELKNGWNPIYQQKEDDVYYKVWMNHYPKATWISGAAIYDLTGNIEAGKFTGFLLMIASFLSVFSIFGEVENKKNARSFTLKALMISFIAAFNPVVLCQIFTYYIDGQVYSILLIVFSQLLGFYLSNKYKYLYGNCFALIIGLNIKFTGVAYLAITVIIFFIFYWIKQKKLATIVKPLIIVSISTIIGLCFVGFNPYVTNLFKYGNPLYPVYGGEQFNQKYIITGQVPDDFLNKNYFSKIFYATFIKPQQGISDIDYSLKVPFTSNLTELKLYSGADLRIGGFGPLWSGIVLVSFPATIFLFLNKDKNEYIGIAIIGVILVTILFNSESWWARYSPQIWLFSIVPVAYLLFSDKKYQRIFGYFLCLILIANLGLVGMVSSYSTIKISMLQNKKLTEIKNSEKGILVYYGVFKGTPANLDRFGIKYQQVGNLEELKCPQELSSGVFYSYQDSTCIDTD